MGMLSTELQAAMGGQEISAEAKAMCNACNMDSYNKTGCGFGLCGCSDEECHVLLGIAQIQQAYETVCSTVGVDLKPWFQGMSDDHKAGTCDKYDPSVTPAPAPDAASGVHIISYSSAVIFSMLILQISHL